MESWGNPIVEVEFQQQQDYRDSVSEVADAGKLVLASALVPNTEGEL